MNKTKLYSRLVSAYEDKSLGLSENGLTFKFIANATFPQFIDIVLKQGKFGGINEHWRPFTTHCNMCRIKYTVIGRVENFDEYLGYIMEKTNLAGRLPNDSSKYLVHTTGIGLSPSKKQSDKMAKVKRYFSTLSDDQILGLHSMYKHDFEMFGYDEHEYLK